MQVKYKKFVKNDYYLKRLLISFYLIYITFVFFLRNYIYFIILNNQLNQINYRVGYTTKEHCSKLYDYEIQPHPLIDIIFCYLSYYILPLSLFIIRYFYYIYVYICM